MAEWRTGVGTSGSTTGGGNTRRIAVLGGYAPKSGAESEAQIIVRRAYTFSELFVRIVANLTISASVYRLRINGANGNQSVTIPAGTSGTFEDLVNTDILVAGDSINSQYVLGATAFVITTVIAYKVEADVFQPLIGTSDGLLSGVSFGATRFSGVIGAATAVVTEADVQYRVRFAATYRNLQFVSRSNTVDGASTVRLRINGVNGNQSITVPASTSGSFEDLINTDNISTNDLINFSIVTGGAAGTLSITILTEQIDAARILGQGGVQGSDIGDGNSLFFPMESEDGFNFIESQLQVRTAVNAIAKNYFVRITVNTLDGPSTATFRVNGADSTLAVIIPASTTGAFEDLTEEISLDVDDLINHRLVTGGSAGVLRQAYIGFQMEALPPVPPLGANLPPYGQVIFNSADEENRPIYGQRIARGTDE